MVFLFFFFSMFRIFWNAISFIHGYKTTLNAAEKLQNYIFLKMDTQKIIQKMKIKNTKLIFSEHSKKKSVLFHFNLFLQTCVFFIFDTLIIVSISPCAQRDFTEDDMAAHIGRKWCQI